MDNKYFSINALKYSIFMYLFDIPLFFSFVVSLNVCYVCSKNNNIEKKNEGLIFMLTACSLYIT